MSGDEHRRELTILFNLSISPQASRLVLALARPLDALSPHHAVKTLTNQ